MDIHVKILFSKFTLRFRNNRGVTAIEYAIIAGSIAIVIIGSLDFIGGKSVV